MTIESNMDISERQTSTVKTGRRSEILFITMGLVIVIFLASTIVLAVLFAIEKSTNKQPPTNNDDDLCLSPFCIKAANYLVESLNQSVEPCEDFYQFACGTWIKNNRIPDDSAALDQISILTRKIEQNIINVLTTPPIDDVDKLTSIINARILFRSCMNEVNIDNEGVNPFLSLIDREFGGWPILQGSSWNESMIDLTDLLSKFHQYDYETVFLIASTPDDRNSSLNIIALGQGTLGLSQRQIYASENVVTNAYRQYIKSIAELFARNTSMIDQDVRDIFELEKNISRYHRSPSEQLLYSNEIIRTTIANLTSVLKINSLDWSNVLRNVYDFANVTLTDTDPVEIREPSFFTNVTSILMNASPRTLHNYLVWRFFMNYAEHMPSNVRAIRERFYRLIQGLSANRPRSSQCARYVNDKMGFAITRLYVRDYFDETARKEAKEMVNNIRKSFVDILHQSTWLDDQSKAKAIEKAEDMYENIGYPDDVVNNTSLEEMYAEHTFNSSFLNNVLIVNRIQAKETRRFLRETIDRNVWIGLPPASANAFYVPNLNKIVFPAGILQTPFFDKDAPKYLNYGGVGTVIGHEITHGFDSMGRQYNKDGNKIPWWTNETIAKFNDRKQCIITQYSNYSWPGIPFTNSGERTQGENIADNGGIKAAFYAYQSWTKNNINVDRRLPGLSKYSPEQLFFISLAHVWCSKMSLNFVATAINAYPHSLPPFRIHGTTSNFNEFDRVFGCTPGQANSQKEKCIVW